MLNAKGQILSDFIYMKYLEQANSQRHKVDQRFPGVGGGWEKKESVLPNGCRASVQDDEKVLEIQQW